MKWYSYLICTAVILIGILASIQLITVFTAQTGTIGTIKYNNKNYQNIIDKSYDMVAFARESEGSNTYKFTDVYDKVADYDGTKNTYKITINGQPCTSTDYGFRYIRSSLVIDFYDTAGKQVAQVTLDILIEFLSSETKLTIVTVNTNECINYLFQLIDNQGLKIVVAEEKTEVKNEN